jgi:hypothetical protein
MVAVITAVLAGSAVGLLTAIVSVTLSPLRSPQEAQQPSPRWPR